MICLTLAAALCAATPAIDLNGMWDFRFEENRPLEEVADVRFAATDTMAVPGCFDVMPKWYMKRGTALYRRTFRLEKPVENAWLVVDGMGLRGEFRIDGRSLGVHPYPYARLELETGPLAAGEHEVFAALDNRFDWDRLKLVRPYYDFYFYGGFYHGVKLVFDNRRLVVRTRDWKTGTVEVEARNFKETDFGATLTFDAKNEVAVQFKKGRATVRVPGFKLWAPAHPNLHTVSLLSGPGKQAVLSARFGIRTIEAKNRKLYLNGEEIYLKGVNRHDAHPLTGAATPQQLVLKDVQLIRELGANFVRGAHYQQSEQFLDLCDEYGILVWEESLGWGNGQFYTDKKGVELTDPGFIAAQIHETREMVRASINHPSIIISAFMNECASDKAACKTLADKLIETIRAEDTGHLVTFACNITWADICNENTDIVAFNTYPGTIPCFPGLPEELAEKVRSMPRKGINVVTARFRKLYPDKTIIVSESGCGGQYGLHDPAAPVGSEEFQNEYLTDLLETIFANPDLCGYAIWQFCDNRTYGRNSVEQAAKPNGGHSIAGLVNVDRKPKMSYQTVKKFFTEKK